MRIDPAPSEPCAIGASPAATVAAAPPLDPPGVRSGSHGLRQIPFSADSVTAVIPNSGVFVLPSRTNPASRSRRTTAVSKSSTLSANARHEYVVRIPAVSDRSLMGSGTPENGPGRGSRASASASSAQTVTYALSVPSSRPIRSRYVSTSSTDDTAPSRTSRACSTAERKARSSASIARDRLTGTTGGPFRAPRIPPPLPQPSAAERGVQPRDRLLQLSRLRGGQAARLRLVVDGRRQLAEPLARVAVVRHRVLDRPDPPQQGLLDARVQPEALDERAHVRELADRREWD